jgi:predicted nucleic-acid-binding protein
MIAVDTNVLVRYIVEDDPAQTAVAAALIERAVQRNEPLFITRIVFCELVCCRTPTGSAAKESPAL